MPMEQMRYFKVCYLTLCVLNYTEGTQTYIYMSFLHTDMKQVVEILPQVRQEITYSTLSISWLLMSCRTKGPGHQQPWYLLCWNRLIRCSHVRCLDVIQAHILLCNFKGNNFSAFEFSHQFSWNSKQQCLSLDFGRIVCPIHILIL